MKMKKHVIAMGLVAGLATVAGAGAVDPVRFQPETHAGYVVATVIAKAKDIKNDGLLQAGSQGGGAAAGGLAAAWLGGKIGGKIGAVIGGPVGLIGGALLGAM